MLNGGHQFPQSILEEHTWREDFVDDQLIINHSFISTVLSATLPHIRRCMNHWCNMCFRMPTKCSCKCILYILQNWCISLEGSVFLHCLLNYIFEKSILTVGIFLVIWDWSVAVLIKVWDTSTSILGRLTYSFQDFDLLGRLLSHCPLIICL